ncbi:sialin-like [Macrosteles quadrilineatus]|uniref:sialin-like n=1 Tax=Macrosteles quadrilineatus TaxID=74068 RepID=UPI0023E1431A|nr:sialin-like [Macrosteles quadrilineatus]
MATPSSDKGCFRRLSDKLTCRQVLNMMVLFGFMVNYMLRVNMTIAIVDMVVPSNTTKDGVEVIHSECVAETPISNVTIDSEPLSTLSTPVDHGIRFPWDAKQQNMIIGSFFWGYICTELPGGRLAEMVGARRVFGYSMLAAAIITLITPLATRVGYVVVVISRVLLGFMLGATWPSVQPMAAKWIPPNERSKFISNMMASSLGAAITLPVCGFLIAHFGWESVFYVTGVIGVIWAIVWFLVVFDHPADHPRISPQERQYIESALGTSSTSTSHKALTVPWKSIITSPPVWAIVITHGASVFGYFTVVNQLPTYMKYILAFNIKENGLLSSLPYFGKYVMAITTSSIADYLRSSGRLSTTAIRKLFTTFAVMVPGLMMIAQVFLGCDRVGSIVIFTAALTVNGAVTAGYLGNGLDIAPNYSGTIFGMANTLSSFGGWLSAYIVGLLTYQNQTYAQWRIVFWILVGTYTVGGLVFLIFGSGDLQSWNTPGGGQSRKPDVEMQNIKEKEAVPLRRDSS